MLGESLQEFAKRNGFESTNEARFEWRYKRVKALTGNRIELFSAGVMAEFEVNRFQPRISLRAIKPTIKQEIRAGLRDTNGKPLPIPDAPWAKRYD